jgi:ABC-type nitrate/sulfonate/bicarbonate transport system substrate-binding protein
LLNAVARGLEVKIVASNGTIKQHRNIGNIIVRKDLAPANGFLDLKTLKPPIRAAATVEGILPHAVLLLEAEKAGFALTDVSMTFLGLPDMNAALQSKNLDIAASGEPLITLAEQQGIAVRWHEMADDFVDLPYSNFLYGPNLLSKDADAGVRLLRAYLQGVAKIAMPSWRCWSIRSEHRRRSSRPCKMAAAWLISIPTAKCGWTR